MPPAGFEPAVHASERPQTHVLNPAATGIGILSSDNIKLDYYIKFCWIFIYTSHLGNTIRCAS
jgi:hypothetical protein